MKNFGEVCINALFPKFSVEFPNSSYLYERIQFIVFQQVFEKKNLVVRW